MYTANDIKEIDFRTLFYYKLTDEGDFYSTYDTSLILKELVQITRILDESKIPYIVDNDFNIITTTID